MIAPPSSDDSDRPQRPPSDELIILEADGPEDTTPRPVTGKRRKELERLRALYYPDLPPLPPLPDEPPA